MSVHPLAEPDLAAADRIFRLAFGTFLGVPDPATFAGDADYIRTRWRADPSNAFAAYLGAEIVGSNIATRWGSVGFFGPLTIRPDLWDRGIGQRLMEPVMACFEKWGTRLAGLYTFAHSQKHVGLYRRFGFWPRFLTALMSRPIDPAVHRVSGWTKFSDLAPHERQPMLAACREVTDAVFEGLDVSSDISAVADQRLGDTVLLWRDGLLNGLAVCHCGPGTEAGTGRCYVKFGAVRAGDAAREDFGRLLAASEALGAEAGASRLSAGVNTGRHEAYTDMLRLGFRTDAQGVAMHKPNEAGYNRPGVFVIDDWR